MFDQLWAASTTLGPRLAKLELNTAVFGPSSHEFGPNCGNVGQTWPRIGRLWPNLGDIDRCWAAVRRCSANFAWDRPNLGPVRRGGLSAQPAPSRARRRPSAPHGPGAPGTTRAPPRSISGRDSPRVSPEMPGRRGVAQKEKVVRRPVVAASPMPPSVPGASAEEGAERPPRARPHTRR